ncbi:phospholipase D gamma 1-like isoform X1 [Cucurbita moschata]|uniref:Phospholipase D alpha 1 n=1 Tax=Cucurbita moschata TaxID=3662 RepID=A0A6J1HJM5_CUCMO|nr:phospholipase D gamma 1-like isoform X1 [Cucurbita moschata]XP_022964033.1 phospholipase D gamma 1-like isoform X1 [Cucurbita moschata]
MDNYGSSPSYPYHNPYAYPCSAPRQYPPASQYPPSQYLHPHYAHPSFDPYGRPLYPYPYSPSHVAPYAYPPHPSHSGLIEYIQHPPSYSGLVSYPYPYPDASSPNSGARPSIHYHSNFQHGTSPYRYQESIAYPSPETQYRPPPSRVNSFSSHYRIDNTDSGSSAHLPIDDLLCNVHLSDHQPNAPASPPAPAAAPVPAQPSASLLANSPQSMRYDRRDRFYGFPNSSFSSFDVGNSDQLTASKQPLFSHSSSFGGSQHNQNLQIVPLHSKASLKVLLLHGNLEIWINEARNLPNMDMFHKTLGDMFAKLPGKIEGRVSHKITSDPYVSISVANAIIGRTFVISNNENPVWRQHFYVPVAHYVAEVLFFVKDSDVVGSQLIGTVAIPAEQIYSGSIVEGTFPILNNGKPCKPGAALNFSIQYTPMERLSTYHHGVGAGPDYQGVPDTYFPLRKGGAVTLYQDAHVPDGHLPNLMLDNGMYYVHGKCWHDIFDSVRQARRLIYITGWSVWHKVKLVRDTGYGTECTLGDLLRSKSQEGVRVLLLVWDDPTSRSILGYKTDGFMQTHDEETRRFFKHSSVQVILCPRMAGKRHSWVKQKEVGTIYTHHQKTVIVDADGGNNRRKIIAFVGGLDLCDGRYDTPSHPIFRTLQTVHKDDYHNPTYTGSAVGCPREPWHDLHSKIEGPAAYDVLTNFEERWRRASKPHGIKKLKSYDDALLRIERIPDIIGISESYCTNENDPESWHVQIFRSIDSSSVKDFPKEPKDAPSKNLVCGKNVLIDMSIHTAYVKAIRAAQHYIYIENQYFIGSSFNWNSNKDLGANNLIPMEIALKIADKIRASERFAAYILIPMWPEGVPTAAATQRILFWQQKTMQMMYEVIYKALMEVGLEDAFSPQDYLNFFCLGNREATEGNDSLCSESPNAENTPQALSRKSRRFMVYVHSKGMIVDDEFVILGSANINQRSMEGTRDTEIAMGAYQPHYTWARKVSRPRGQIYGYRMSLWAEHTGTMEDCFNQPESLECVKKLRTIGESSWKQFAGEDVTEMRGHLLKYPVEVDRRGRVRSLPGHENFPDVGGKIVGSFLGIHENLTI